jgi:hypothetical protein
LYGEFSTRKGLDVQEWPNWSWAMSLDLNLFLDILKLFVNMHLGISFAGVQIS